MKHLNAWAITLSLTLPASLAYGQSAMYQFSGPACATQGAWTQGALVETKKILQAVQELANDKDNLCGGIGQVLGDLNVASSALSSEGNSPQSGEDLANEQKVSSLAETSQAIVGKNGPNPKIMGVVYDQLLDLAANSSFLKQGVLPAVASKAAGLSGFTKMYQRSEYTATQGMNALSSVMKVLPSYESCLFNHPKTGVLLLSGIVKMTASLRTSGSGFNNAIGNTLQGLATLLQKRVLATKMRQENQVVFSQSVACLVETVSQHWCDVDNAQSIAYEFQKIRARSLNKTNSKNRLSLQESNPLNGYYMLVREIPLIAQWLQRVQLGATPNLHTDSQFLNEVTQNTDAFITASRDIQANFNEGLARMKTLPTVEAKRNHLFGMLSDLAGKLAGSGDRGGGSSAQFFIAATNIQALPFILIGRGAEIPDQVSGKTFPQLAWADYMQKNPETRGYVPEFNDPEDLAQIIQTQMKKILDDASEYASAYYQNFLLNDRVNLINEASVGTTISVRGAFLNIYVYLSGLEKKLIRLKNSPATLLSVQDLKAKIRMINLAIKEFEARGTIVDHQFTQAVNNGAPVPKVDTQKDLADAAAKVIDTVYDQFKIKLNKDGFVTNRMRTIVQMDLKMLLQEEIEHPVFGQQDSANSSFSKSVLSAKGNAIANYLLQTFTEDPTLAQLDLDQAKNIETVNLRSLGQVFSDQLYYMILDQKSYVKGWDGDQMDQAIREKLSSTFPPNRLYDALHLSSRMAAPTHPDLAAQLGRNEKLHRLNDRFHSNENLLGFYCALTLSLPNRGYFMDACKGAKLASYYTEQSDSLDLSYDKYMPNAAAARSVNRSGELFSGAVCAFNHYLINNRLAYLRDQILQTRSQKVSDRADLTEEMMNEADAQSNP